LFALLDDVAMVCDVCHEPVTEPLARMVSPWLFRRNAATNAGSALDAPLNLQDKLARMALVTAVVSGASAGMTLTEQIVKALDDKPTGTTIVIEDRDGRMLGKVTPATPVEDVYTVIVGGRP
jgi:hypothetical protein